MEEDSSSSDQDQTCKRLQVNDTPTEAVPESETNVLTIRRVKIEQDQQENVYDDAAHFTDIIPSDRNGTGTFLPNWSMMVDKDYQPLVRIMICHDWSFSKHVENPPHQDPNSAINTLLFYQLFMLCKVLYDDWRLPLPSSKTGCLLSCSEQVYAFWKHHMLHPRNYSRFCSTLLMQRWKEVGTPKDIRGAEDAIIDHSLELEKAKPEVQLRKRMKLCQCINEVLLSCDTDDPFYSSCTSSSESLILQSFRKFIIREEFDVHRKLSCILEMNLQETPRLDHGGRFATLDPSETYRKSTVSVLEATIDPQSAVDSFMDILEEGSPLINHNTNTIRNESTFSQSTRSSAQHQLPSSITSTSTISNGKRRISGNACFPISTPIPTDAPWDEVWDTLTQQYGFSLGKGSGSIYYYYLTPKFRDKPVEYILENGTLNRDYFDSEDSLMNYVRQNFGWIGPSTRSSTSNFVRTNPLHFKKRRLSICSQTNVSSSTSSQSLVPCHDETNSLHEATESVSVSDHSFPMDSEDAILQTQGVTSLPLADFPLEMVGDIDLDPALPDDYRTVFSSSGCVDVLEESALDSTLYEEVTVPSSYGDLTEDDKNTDACVICTKVGTLVCCDKCPRSFHAKCVGATTDSLPEMWMCGYCKDDAKAAAVSGLAYMDTIGQLCSIFDRDGNTTTDVSVLSKIVEMIDCLMGHHFGVYFSSIMDVKKSRNYNVWIERPIDLRQIKENILCGEYCRTIHDLIKDRGLDQSLRNSSSISLVIYEILKDIETVWQNCFLYNLEDSAVYRMGQVLKEKCTTIQELSFRSNLNSNVLFRLDIFVKSCTTKRQKGFSPMKMFKPRTNLYKIEGLKVNKNSKSQPVGVLNPNTRMLAKMYSCVKNAYKAYLVIKLRSKLAEDLSANLTESKFNAWIHESNDDPSKLLFGYRWLHMNKLRKGEVKFNVSTETTIIESQTNQPQFFPPSSSLAQRAQTETKGILGRPVSVHKICKRTDQIIKTFDGITSAARDWSQMLKDPSLDPTSLSSLDIFLRQYLLGTKDVNGIVWQIRNKSTQDGDSIANLDNMDSRQLICDAIDEFTNGYQSCSDASVSINVLSGDEESWERCLS